MSSYFLTFDKQPSVNGYALFEVSEELLKEVTTGGTLLLRGQAGTEAVVCTDSTTYQLRQIENSNTCMLIPPNETVPSEPTEKVPKLVRGLVNCHYDLIKIFPRLYQLRKLLHASPFTIAHDRVLLQLYQYDIEAYRRVLAGGCSDFSSGLSLSVPIGNDNGKRIHHETVLTPTSIGLKVNSTTLPHVSGYTMEELSRIVQASSRELRRGLMDIAAFSLEGMICVADSSLMDTVHDALVDIIGAERWGAVVDANRVVEELLGDGVCSPVIAVSAMVLAATPEVREQMAMCLSTHREMMRDGYPTMDAFEKALEIDDSRITVANLEPFFGINWRAHLFAFLPAKLELSVAFFAQFKARQILRQCDNNTALLSEFISQWNSALPPSLQPLPIHLSGVALVEDPVYNPVRGYKSNSTVNDLLKWDARSNQATVTLFDASTLSEDPAARFEQLFTFRPQWTVPAIKPYVERFTGPGLSLDQLLLRHARAIKVGPGSAEEQTTIYTWK